MIVGLDFDNTIVSYDALFHRVAFECGHIPAGLSARKEAVRDHLRAAGVEQIWTEMQGMVYGSRMDEAHAFDGCLEAISSMKKEGHRVIIVSHKTRYPFLGNRHDLHAAARGWLESRGFFSPQGLGFLETDVFFELTKEEKLSRIARESCTHFVDDLPEILTHPLFPSGVGKLLFCPGTDPGIAGIPCVSNWKEIPAWVTR